MINRQKNLKDKFMASVKVGSKGQIVIPQEVRKMFKIEPGDTLLLLADVKRGIAMHHYDVLKEVMDGILDKTKTKKK